MCQDLRLANWDWIGAGCWVMPPSLGAQSWHVMHYPNVPCLSIKIGMNLSKIGGIAANSVHTRSISKGFLASWCLFDTGLPGHNCWFGGLFLATTNEKVTNDGGFKYVLFSNPAWIRGGSTWLNHPSTVSAGESLQVWLKKSPGPPWWFDLGAVYATWPMVVPARNESWRRVNEQHEVDGCSIYERISTLSCCMNVHIWDYLCVQEGPRFPTTSIIINI